MDVIRPGTGVQGRRPGFIRAKGETAMELDLVVSNCWLVDPKNGINGRYDIGIARGKVVTVEPCLDDMPRRGSLDAAGRLVIPGMIDSHAHIGGSALALREMARAGVTTGVDYGAYRKLIGALPNAGSGMCVAGLQTIGPWVETQPTLNELETMVDQVTSEGALGIKIMGGHSPSTPSATARMIQAANNRKAYVGYHVGTTESSSNLLGLRETFELAGRNRLHIAHMNAYLRGMVRPPLEENIEALERLAAAYWMVSETHLGPRNGTGGAMDASGMPRDWVTRNCLRMRGYELSTAGMEKAFLDGYIAVNIEKDDRMVQLTGRDGLEVWQQRETRVGVSFPVNLRSTALICATARVRRAGGATDFVVDAISTDGGTWRNYLAQNGLALVRFGSLTIEEFVKRVSWIPATMYGMLSKGHLAAGADADISILDFERLSAYATIVGGEVIMLDSAVIGRGATVVCTVRGKAYLEERGLRTQVVDIERSLFWTKGDHDPGPGVIEIS